MPVCTSPIVLSNDKYQKKRYGKTYVELNNTMTVNCGYCMSCRINRASEWSLRIMNEYDDWNRGIFVTLTYDNEHLPENYSLVKSDLQKFFKRLRKNLGPERKIKYFACGEYGEKRSRPHYHAIILGLDELDHDYVNQSWKFGLIDFGTVTHQSTSYVASYTTKKIGSSHNTTKDKLYYINERKPPFQLVSQGFGLNFAKKHEERLKNDLFISLNGKKKPLPRYYRRKLGITIDDYREKGVFDPDRYDDIDKKVAKKLGSYIDYLSDKPFVTQLEKMELQQTFNRVKADSIRQSLKQYNLEIEAKVNLRKRDKTE